MGIFGRIGTYVNEKVEQRKRSAEQEKKERQEIEAATKKALKEERIKAAPSLAKQQVQIEMKQKLAAVKAGKTSGFGRINLGGLQNLGHDIGQSTRSGFNKDFDMMFGGTRGGLSSQKSKQRVYGSSEGFGRVDNAFTRDYERLQKIGLPISKSRNPKYKRKRK